MQQPAFKQPESLLRGQIKAGHLFHVLNYLERVHANGKLEILSDGLGEIFLQNGQVVHASVAAFTGQAAILHMSDWGGNFEFLVGVETDHQTIHQTVEHLALHSAVTQDENQAGLRLGHKI